MKPDMEQKLREILSEAKPTDAPPERAAVQINVTGDGNIVVGGDLRLTRRPMAIRKGESNEK
jgi:hypothetical protein